jgi:hypothetical protein
MCADIIAIHDGCQAGIAADLEKNLPGASNELPQAAPRTKTAGNKILPDGRLVEFRSGRSSL